VSGKATISAVGDDWTHLVQVNVLGLAGITVDRQKGRGVGKKKECPPPPKRMRAVVAVSRGEQVKGTTSLSKPLAPSPTHDVVVPNQDRINYEAQTQAPDLNKTYRNVAIWASDNEAPLGSMMAFDVNLQRLDYGDGQSTSSHFLPKCFELTIALAEDTEQANKVALPVGVANLSISADQFQNGETFVIDLPILGLKQARPLALDRNGLGGFQMLSIHEKNKPGYNPRPEEKKKNGFKRLFGRNGSSKSQKVPSVAARKLFSSVYSTAAGDSILRIELTIIEKGVGREFLRNADFLAKKSIASGITNAPKLDDQSESGTARSSKSPAGTAETEADSANSLHTSSYSDESTAISGSVTKDSQDSQTLRSGGSTLDRSHGSETLESAERMLETLKFSSIRRFNLIKEADQKGQKKNKLYSKPVGTTDEDECTLSFEPQKKPPIEDNSDDRIMDLAVFKVFGKEVRIPSCGPLVMLETEDGPRARFFDDDITHVTGEFFGRDFQIPICSSIIPREDEETITLHMNDTFSTISGDQGTVQTQRNTLLKNFLRDQRNEKDEALFAKTQKALHDTSVDGTLDAFLDGTFDGTLEEILDATLSSKEEKEKNSLKDEKHSLQEAISLEKDVKITAVVDSLQVENLPEGPVRLRLIQPVSEPPKTSNEVLAAAIFQKVNSKDKKDPIGISKRSPSMTESIREMFRCAASTVDDQATGYNAGAVPLMVIRKDEDSVGELTAITFKADPNPQNPKQKKLPLPIALGGSGMCSNMRLVDDGEFMETLDALELTETSSVLDASVLTSSRENYFSDYDDYILTRPRTCDSNNKERISIIRSPSTASNGQRSRS
jgi:hypothetical protein